MKTPGRCACCTGSPGAPGASVVGISQVMQMKVALGQCCGGREAQESRGGAYVPLVPGAVTGDAHPGLRSPAASPAAVTLLLSRCHREHLEWEASHRKHGAQEADGGPSRGPRERAPAPCPRSPGQPKAACCPALQAPAVSPREKRRATGQSPPGLPAPPGRHGEEVPAEGADLPQAPARWP